MWADKYIQGVYNNICMCNSVKWYVTLMKVNLVMSTHIQIGHCTIYFSVSPNNSDVYRYEDRYIYVGLCNHVVL